eukprot:gene30472-37692_t
MLAKLQAEDPSAPKVDMIFLDTLHHFPETLELVERMKAQYPEDVDVVKAINVLI